MVWKKALIYAIFIAMHEADDVFVREVIDLLDDLGAREYASAIAAAYSAAALQHLQDAKPTGEAAEALLQLADMLLQRDY